MDFARTGTDGDTGGIGSRWLTVWVSCALGSLAGNPAVAVAAVDGHVVPC